MLHKTLCIITALSTISMQATHVKNPDRSPYALIHEAESVYKTVYDHYSDILQVYYKLEKVPLEQQDYYTHKLIDLVSWHVQQDKLPLYGNFINRLWRNVSSSSANTQPLKKFVDTLTQDALGHLDKYHKKLVAADADSIKITDLIKSIKNIQSIIQTSLHYKIEELKCTFTNLEKQVSNLRSELQQEKDKNSKLEHEIRSLRAHSYSGRLY